MEVIFDVNDLWTPSKVMMSSILEGSHKGQQYSTLLRIRLLYRSSMVFAERSENTLSHHADIFRALSVMMFIWGDQDKSGTMFIPRSLTM